jgi:hypothetical protein
MKFIFRGTVTERHTLKLSQRKTFDTFLLTFPEGTEVDLTITKATKKRSNAYNSYYWSVPVWRVAHREKYGQVINGRVC